MISKELLSEVLGFSIGNCWNDGVLIVWKEDGMSDINIYELAHKCKEWANSFGYDLYSHRFDANASYSYLDLDIKGIYRDCEVWRFSGNYLEEFEGDTEAEAIFKACQWILDKKGE